MALLFWPASDQPVTDLEELAETVFRSWAGEARDVSNGDKITPSRERIVVDLLRKLR